jgi:threonine dehydrogenase-like Zn-dependent dehydrogenase
MKATCWMGLRDVQVRNVPDPIILNSRDAIIKITSTAICGSDLHLYNGFIPSMRKGDVVGHEFMGEVVELGRDVRNLEIGDRVVVPFPIACGRCEQCSREMYSLCENSNPNAWMAEKMWGYSPCGVFGYSHLLGGYAGGQSEYARVPFARRRTDQDSGRARRRPGALPFRHSSDRVHGRGNVRDRARRRRGRLGLRTCWPVSLSRVHIFWARSE